MTPIVLDFETYYAQDYSLSKMSTEAYVRDPRFEIICVGIKGLGKETQMVWGDANVRNTLSRLPWERIVLICQNTAFDGFILSEQLGIYPAMYCDTMSMFRRLYPHKRASLKVIAETLGLPSKGTEIVNAKGKRAADFTPAERQAFLDYCALDCALTEAAWEKLKVGYPMNELRLIDLTIRMVCNPVLRLDPVPLTLELQEQRRLKEELLSRVEADKGLLMSNNLFAEELQKLGVEPPRKISPTALKKNPALAGDPDAPTTWAFGKTDKGMKALLNHENPEVVALVEARLGVKSTIKETRAETFLGVSSRGTLPVPLLYYGAHTGRWSGGGGLNLQNLTRGSRLRDAILPPEGERLLVCDLSGIEMRVLAWFAGQGDVIDTVRSGGDVYCQMATVLYGRPITKKDKRERQVGKTLILGCGYSMSWKKFAEYTAAQNMIFTAEDCEAMGVDMARARTMTKKSDLTPHEAAAWYAVSQYRSANWAIAGLWREAEQALHAISAGHRIQVGHPEGVVFTSPQGFDTPDGGIILYPGLKQDGKTWVKHSKEGTSYLHGGLVVENIVQHLSRQILSWQMLKAVQAGLHVVLTCHDEIVCVAPEAEAEEQYAVLERIMKTAPSWAVGLPLDAEGGTGANYGEAK